MQRQITEALEYIHSNDRHLKWRLNWFNEVKYPMLTACILFDNGKAHLKQRIDVLHSLVIKNTNPPLHGDEPKLSAEEEFVRISMKSKTMHARAKLIVM